MVLIERPTNSLVSVYIDKFNTDERYYPADQAIIKLFSAFPENKILEDILLKLSVINDMYSTQIFATYRLALHIQGLNIDHLLKPGDPKAVHLIASGHGITNRKGTELNFYSFATKYCNWHNQESYAIYDSFVEKLLLAYRKQDYFSKFRNSDLKDFPKFKKIIQEFIAYYHLTDFNLKEIDKFLWIYGKELFPAKY
ncbi:MAG: hypothetical protein K9G38_02700 [Bacteroidales bacterium]|nr:hypothetical protein [Bacteroidales bacterium]